MKHTIVNLGEFCYVIQGSCNNNKCKDCKELTYPDKEL